METLLYLALFGLAMFVMMRFGCGAHAMGHGRHRHPPTPDGQRPETPPRWIAPEKDKDPVCGMVIDTVGAKSAVHDGDVYYFCSSTCRDKFEAAPGSYAKPAGAKPEYTEHRHGAHC